MSRCFVPREPGGEGEGFGQGAGPVSADARDPYFDTRHLQSDLGGRTIRGGVIVLASQAVRFSLQMVSTAVLARLLTPADYGVVAMAAAITGFIGLFRDVGLPMATVQRAEINHEEVSALFWINAGLGAVIAALCAGLGPVAALFYGEPRLRGVMAVLGVGFLMAGLTAQHQALLRRRMRFMALARIEVGSVIVGFAAGIAAAWCGAGYWALVLVQVVTFGYGMVATWLVNRWRPQRPRLRGGIRDMLVFGGYLSLFNVVHYFTRNADKLLIGKFLGASPLGLYAKAYQLLLLPVQQINTPLRSVAVPALARLQADGESLRQYFCRCVNTSAYLAMPLTALLAAVSHEVVWILLGPQWLPAARIFRLLAAAALVQPVINALGWLLIALGLTRLLCLLAVSYTPVFVIAFAVGLKWGALGVAGAYVVCDCCCRLPLFLYALRNSPVSAAHVWRAVWHPAALSLTAFAVASGVRLGVLRWTDSPWAVLLMAGAAGTGAAVAMAWLWAGPREEIRFLYRRGGATFLAGRA